MRPGSSASVRDRTDEWRSLVERLSRSQAAGPGPYSAAAAGGAAAAAGRPQSDFAPLAAAIGAAIGKAEAKLARLGQLARRTGMFDDPSAQIDELTGIIKHEVTQIQASIAELQKSAAAGGGGSRQGAEHAAAVVESLRGRLRDCTAEFKEVLTTRTEAMKASSERRQLFSSTPEPAASFLDERAPLLPASAGDAGAGRSATTLFGGQQVRQRRGGGAAGEASGSDGSPSHRHGGGGQQQQQLFAPQQQGYTATRAEALHSVEATIVELGSMFTQLAEMVASQGEAAARIDDNIGETLAHVDAAKGQLMRYLNSISSNRGLMLKLLLVIMIMLAVFVLFVA